MHVMTMWMAEDLQYACSNNGICRSHPPSMQASIARRAMAYPSECQCCNCLIKLWLNLSMKGQPQLMLDEGNKHRLAST